MSSLHYKKFTFCKYFVRVCGWCMHLVCYRSVQSRIMTVFFSILLPSKKEKNKFLLLSYFCKPWYDAIGKISILPYVHVNIFSSNYIKNRIKFFAQNQYKEKGVDISQCLMTNAFFAHSYFQHTITIAIWTPELWTTYIYNIM